MNLKYFLPVMFFLASFSGTSLYAQKNTNHSAFRHLQEEFSTPNYYRTASGAPGQGYWQQKADYVISVTLDDREQKIYGEESITYHNNSPDPLNYLWIQLDQNVREKNSYTKLVSTSRITDPMSFRSLQRLFNDFDGGFKLKYVQDAKGRDLPHTVNYTMMRVDLPQPLKHGDSYVIRIKWWYNINDRAKVGGRSGMEYFPEEDNYIYTIAQFYPRMAVYNDYEGWQNRQFIGSGEFTLPFGDFDVKITVPADHILGATGVLQNPDKVLTARQRERLKKARTSDAPVMIVTEEEARAREKTKDLSHTKTWHFKANNVRDFAFATSRKFIWDAMGVPFGNRIVMAMSYYPKEGNPLWEHYSTRVVAHTIKTYSKYTFDFPYPKAISVHTAHIGMEYPMICFNGGRPEPDGTYSERTKYSMISVIIHEVGHNFFPMIVNSDERQWTWMDEGLNTFLQGIAEREWDHNFPHWRGNPADIVDYMSGDPSTMVPIMTNSESLLQFGNNAYAKPATALNILRETVMGRELFDFAFKQYARRWEFKHPTPEDLFRTMEDASAVNLDWFWRGWFYTTDHVDISLDKVAIYQINTKNPEIEKPLARQKAQQEPEQISITRNKHALQTAVEQDPSLKDFYNSYDRYEVTAMDMEKYQGYLSSLTDEEKKLLEKNDYFYELTFSNVGGLVMPIILEFTFEDNTKKRIQIPAEIWRRNNKTVSKVFPFPKRVKQIVIDPLQETADTDLSNNAWPPIEQINRFELFKYNYPHRPNPMQQQQKQKSSKK
jgi:hypothetical protein